MESNILAILVKRNAYFSTVKYLEDGAELEVDVDNDEWVVEYKGDGKRFYCADENLVNAMAEMLGVIKEKRFI